MLFGLIETVIVDKVSRKNGFIDLDVHAKYDDSKKWKIKKILTDIKIDNDWQLKLWSATKTEYVKRDESMPNYVDVIYLQHINTKGNMVYILSKIQRLL